MCVCVCVCLASSDNTSVFLSVKVHGKAGAWSIPFAKSASVSETLELEPLAVYLAFIAE